MKNVFGCKKPQFDIRDYKIACTMNTADLPATYSYGIKKLPKVKNQGAVCSCVAHATSSILERYAANKVTLSTNFIYGMDEVVSGYDDPGMYLVDACKIAKEYGDMLERDCSGNDEVPDATKIAKLAVHDQLKAKRAKNYCIDSYYRCDTTNDIKYAIYKYGVVLACVYWHTNGRYLDSKATIEFDTTSDGGYHAIMLYGWTKDGWLVQNSWGTNFGNKGRCILPYKYPIVEARVLVDETPAPDSKDIKKPKKIVKKKVIYKPINKIINRIKKNIKTK